MIPGFLKGIRRVLPAMSYDYRLKIRKLPDDYPAQQKNTAQRDTGIRRPVSRIYCAVSEKLVVFSGICHCPEHEKVLRCSDLDIVSSAVHD